MHYAAGPACPTKMPRSSLIAENVGCEEERLEEETKSGEEPRTWDYRLLKVFLML